MAINSILQTYINQAKDLITTEEVFYWLTELGNEINAPSIRTTECYLNGCQSQVWLRGYESRGVWTFEADSDSSIVRGLCRIIIDTVNGNTAAQIQSLCFHDFSSIARMLPMARQRGIQSMINRIHHITQGTT